MIAIAAYRRKPPAERPRSLIHQRILDAALSRDADLAVKLLTDHIDEATKLIVNGLSALETKRKPAKAESNRPGQKSNRCWQGSFPAAFQIAFDLRDISLISKISKKPDRHEILLVLAYPRGRCAKGHEEAFRGELQQGSKICAAGS